MLSESRHARRAGSYYGWNIVAVVAVAQIAGMGLSINCMSLFPALAARTYENLGSYGPAMLMLATVSITAGALALMMRQDRGNLATVPPAIGHASAQGEAVNG